MFFNIDSQDYLRDLRNERKRAYGPKNAQAHQAQGVYGFDPVVGLGALADIFKDLDVPAQPKSSNGIPVSIVDRRGDATYLIFQITGYDKSDVDLTVKENNITVSLPAKNETLADLLPTLDVGQKAEDEDTKDNESKEETATENEAVEENQKQQISVLHFATPSLLGSSTRTVRMKRSFDPQTITAKAENGVLIVTVPHPAKPEGEKINID